MRAVKTDTGHPHCRGFSLIELVVVVTIIGILASIAIPQYSDYVRRAKLTDGTAALADLRVKFEQYFQDNRNYGPTAASPCGFPIPTNPPPSLYFTYTCVVNAATLDTYTATATSVAGSGMGPAGAYVYTFDEQNVRTTPTFKGVVVNKPCWLISGAEC